ncbi:MAG: hypothetical protein IPG18_02730 [Saprospiraceae bacterium]|nr:hypothetical protein [Saprospiraceae bacterium]
MQVITSRMNDFLKANNSELSKIVDEFFLRKLKFNNYFGLEFSDVEYLITDKTLILRKSFESFFRIYILSECEKDLISVLSNLDKSHIINIPTKKQIEDWDNVLVQSNYECYAVYERLNNKNCEKRGDFEPCYAEIADINEIMNVLNSTFSPITAWLPTRKELVSFINDNKVLVNKDEIGVSGVLIFTIENKKVYFNAWASIRGQGLFLILNVFNLMAEIGIKNSYLWTNSENKKAKKIYSILGFEADGLKDYTYIKK